MENKFSDFTMVNGQVLVAIDAPQDMTDSGIAVPEKSRARPQTARVLAVNAYNDLGLRAGQRVFYERLAGHPITIDGEQLHIIPLAAVYAVIPEGREVR